MDEIKSWQLYQVGRDWYWRVWDEVNSRWWVSDPFDNYDEAKIARNSMMSDTYQQPDPTDAQGEE